MITIKTPATSANVGPGFDCFGLAFNLYNTFEVELSDQNILENVEERFNNPDNIFLKAYHLVKPLVFMIIFTRFFIQKFLSVVGSDQALL